MKRSYWLLLGAYAMAAAFAIANSKTGPPNLVANDAGRVTEVSFAQTTEEVGVTEAHARAPNAAKHKTLTPAMDDVDKAASRTDSGSTNPDTENAWAVLMHHDYFGNSARGSPNSAQPAEKSLLQNRLHASGNATWDTVLNLDG